MLDSSSSSTSRARPLAVAAALVVSAVLVNWDASWAPRLTAALYPTAPGANHSTLVQLEAASISTPSPTEMKPVPTPSPAVLDASACSEWAAALGLNVAAGGPTRIEARVPLAYRQGGKPRVKWWNTPKYPPVDIPIRYPSLANMTVSGVGFAGMDEMGGGPRTVFCPGTIRVRVTCVDCMELSGAVNWTRRLVASTESAAVRDAPIANASVFAAGEPTPTADLLLTNQSVSSRRTQPVWEHLLRRLRFGPDGFVGRLEGPESHFALGTVASAAASDALSFELKFEVGRVAHAIGIGAFELNVQHVWAAWLHVLQHQHYAVTDPQHVASYTLHVLLPPPGALLAPLTDGVWQRFDSVPSRRSSDNHRMSPPLPSIARPPQRAIFPYDSRDKMTHTTPCWDGWYWWRPPAKYVVPKVLDAVQELLPTDTWSDRGDVTLLPPPAVDCSDLKIKIIPPGSCYLRRVVWRLLNVRSAKTKRFIFHNTTFALGGESQGSQLQRQIEALSEGRLDDHKLELEPNTKLAAFTVTSTNNAIVPFSNLVATGSAPRLSYFKTPPTAKIASTRTSNRLRMTFLWHSEHTELNVTRVPAEFAAADFVGFMFCQFCIILGLAVEDYEVRFARFLLGLHGIGPDAARVNGTIPGGSIVFVSPCAPVPLRNSFAVRNTVDHYRIRYRDHRTVYSTALYAASTERVVNFVNAELRRHRRHEVLFIDLTSAFLPRIDDTYDGDHFYASDSNFAASAMLLHELAAERLRRDQTTGVL